MKVGLGEKRITIAWDKRLVSILYPTVPEWDSQQPRLFLQQIPFQIKSRLNCTCPDLVLVGWHPHLGYEIELWDHIRFCPANSESLEHQIKD